MLYDNHGRLINYMRLAVTDRCNLRCFYCMPAEGIRYVDRKELLQFEEMERLVQVLCAQGISKLRITGGEPFVRKGMMEFLERISKMEGLEHIHLTTNGTFDSSYIPRFKKARIKSVNLSLDSLDPKRFFEITRRDAFEEVMSNFGKLQEEGLEVKVNMVVMDGKNIADIFPMLELARDQPVSIRFIEEMPFNGTLGQGNKTVWPMRKILAYVQEEYPELIKIPDGPFSTSSNYQIPGFKGTFGIIAAYTRSFCGSCNRIRITSKGNLKTCLYGSEGLSFRDLMRAGVSDEELITALKGSLNQRAKDGFEAEKKRKPIHESMATIGG